MKIFCHTFLKNCKGYKVKTLMCIHGQWANVLYILESGLAHDSCHELKIFIIDFSGTMNDSYKVET